MAMLRWEALPRHRSKATWGETSNKSLKEAWSKFLQANFWFAKCSYQNACQTWTFPTSTQVTVHQKYGDTRQLTPRCIRMCPPPSGLRRTTKNSVSGLCLTTLSFCLSTSLNLTMSLIKSPITTYIASKMVRYSSSTRNATKCLGASVKPRKF